LVVVVVNQLTSLCMESLTTVRYSFLRLVLKENETPDMEEAFIAKKHLFHVTNIVNQLLAVIKTELDKISAGTPDLA
jgi:hypothetical protein